jgi:tetratricopeptide (TPR) repeat protein
MRLKRDNASYRCASTVAVLVAAVTVVALSACGTKSQDNVTGSANNSGATATQRSEKDIMTDISMAEISKKMSPELPREADRLARKYAAEGKLKEAESVLGRLVALCRMPEVNDQKNMSLALNNLGVVYLKQGDYKKAEQMLQTSLVLQQQVLGPTSPDFAEGVANLALLYYQQQRYADAAPLYNRAMEILKKVPPDQQNKEQLSRVTNNLATCYSHEKKFDEARQLFNETIALDEARLGKDNPEVALTLNNIAYTFIMEKQYDQAESSLKRAVEIAEKAHGADSLQLVPYLQNYQSLMKKISRVDESRKLAARVKSITEAHIH